MRAVYWSFAAAGLAAAGCGGPPSLSGVVRVDGRPLDQAVVVLTPDAPGAELVVGSTDPDGRFVVTPAAGAQIAPGTYRVTVSKRREAARPKKPTPPPPDETFPGAGAVGGPLALPPETIPVRYSDLSQTVLSVTVPAGGEVAFDLTTP